MRSQHRNHYLYVRITLIIWLLNENVPLVERGMTIKTTASNVGN